MCCADYNLRWPAVTNGDQVPANGRATRSILSDMLGITH
jgi:hypothetical protein